MKSKLKHWRGFIIILSITMGLIIGPISQVYAANPKPGVIPPNTEAYGMTYGEWSAAWWKWVYSIPADTHPLNDALPSPVNDGECSHVAVGQHGPVWFLGGAWSAVPTPEGGLLAKAVRTCKKIPTDKAIFFPVINAECSTLEGNGDTYDLLSACAKDLVDSATAFTATIDGVVVQDLNKYRAKSPPFTFGPLPEGNLLGKESGAETLAAADGYYLMVAPLSKGQHTIQFTAYVPAYNFVLDITYNLTVTDDYNY